MVSTHMSLQRPAAEEAAHSRRPASRRRWVRWAPAVLFLAPAVAILAVFRVLPFVYAGYYSLTEWDGIEPPTFVGVDNYARLLSDPVALEAIKNTGLLVLTLPLWIFLPMAIAILVHEGMWLGRAIRLALVIPILLSPAIIGLYFSLVLRLDGPVNELLGAIGLGGLATEWLAEPHTVMPAFLTIALWGALGLGTLFYGAGLASLDDELYEAAAIDGASTLQRVRHVTIPHLRPVAVFWSLFVLISFFTAMFPLLFTLTSGGPGHRSTTIDLYIYQAAFENFDFGYSAALGTSVLLLVAVLAVIQLRLIARGDEA